MNSVLLRVDRHETIEFTFNDVEEKLLKGQVPCQCVGREHLNSDPPPWFHCLAGLVPWEETVTKAGHGCPREYSIATNTSISTLSQGYDYSRYSVVGGLRKPSHSITCVNSSSQPHTTTCPSPTAASFAGISRHQTAKVWDAFEYSKQPKCVRTADPKSKPTEPRLLPGLSPPQCQPAHGHSRQEGCDGRLTVGNYYGPQQWTGECICLLYTLH